MTNRQRLEEYVIKNPDRCDDCIGQNLDLRRQAVQAEGKKSSVIQRAKGTCANCHRYKTISSGDTVRLSCQSPEQQRADLTRYKPLRNELESSAPTKPTSTFNDPFDGFTIAELIRLKGENNGIDLSITKKLTLALVDHLASRLKFEGKIIQALRNAANLLHPTTNGFDIDSYSPNIIAEVKGNLPAVRGKKFRGNQVTRLNEDVLLMLGRLPPNASPSIKAKRRAKIDREDRIRALKFIGLYDSPSIREATAAWSQNLMGSQEWNSEHKICELPDHGTLSPNIVYLVYLAPK